MEGPQRIQSERVSAHFFDVFKSVPALGRAFVVGDDQLGHDHVAVISNKFWLSQLGADPGILGRQMVLDGEAYTIIGVMPPGAFDLSYTKIWRPLSFPPEGQTREFHWLNAFGLLKPGITIEQARTRMDALAIRMAHDYPKTNKGYGIAVDSIESLLDPNLKLSLYTLMGAVGMVLLIVCANLANLTLVRGLAREREAAIMAALGASRWRLVRRFLVESVLLSIVGGAAGLLLGYEGLAGLKTTMPPRFIPPNARVDMDGRVLLFTVALVVVTTILFGLYPALKAAGSDISKSMKDGGQGMSAGASSGRLRATLVAAEVSLAFVLLTGAGLLVQSLFRMLKVDTGVNSTHVLTARLPFADRSFAAKTNSESIFAGFRMRSAHYRESVMWR